MSDIVFLTFVSCSFKNCWDITKFASCMSPSVSHFQYDVAKFCIEFLSFRNLGKDSLPVGGIKIAHI